MAIDRITVRGARQHNLKNVSVEIPRDRLTVVTGLSGSGKSSLAFDTIYAEGQRRYVESLSAYARQFLDQLERPDVDSVDGLSPAISIEQKTVSRSPRSTVGTVTEVYDYLRLLFSSVGQPHCHICGAAITRQSVEQIVQSVLGLPEGERVMVLAPVVRGRKGEFRKELEKLAKDGFLRARIDGDLTSLDEEIKLDKRRNHTIEAVVDRLLIKPGINERLTESVRTALKLTGGAVLISVVDGEEKLYSERMACVNCGINVPPLEPRSFSFNSAYGACKRCHGLGTVLEIDPAKLIPDANERADRLVFLGAADKQGSAYLKSALAAVAEHSGAPLAVPFAELPKNVREAFFHGVEGQITFRQGLYSYQGDWKGAIRHLRERMNDAPSEKVRVALEELVSPVGCPECEGRRLQPESLAVRVGGLGIADYTALPIESAAAVFDKIKLNAREEQIAGLVLREVRNRINFLAQVGLGYLTLDRPSATLSGGEGQRIRLATQIGSQLRGVLYVLDEPSIGLHPRDNQKLLETLTALRDLGNTVLVVEPDEETIRRADSSSVPTTREDFPEPETPVTVVSTPMGILTETSRRLWSVAPSIRIIPFAARGRAPARPSVRRPDKNAPVIDAGSCAIAAGVPCAITRPPSTPAPGPMSITPSAARTTSRSCSTTSTVEPVSRSRSSVSTSLPVSRGWRPIDGSSST